jgi:hypothetical protein
MPAFENCTPVENLSSVSPNPSVIPTATGKPASAAHLERYSQSRRLYLSTLIHQCLLILIHEMVERAVEHLYRTIEQVTASRTRKKLA